jgi:ribosomal protein S18 acetylase RimI-like enzyme
MDNITFSDSTDSVTQENLQGFFVGWNNPPSSDTHLHILKESTYRILALDGEKVVGFITAITDKTLSAYIPFLEVLPEYQKKGIGQELVKRMLKNLEGYYMIDLLCDPELQSFYEKLGMQKASGMNIRNYKNQRSLKS